MYYNLLKSVSNVECSNQELVLCRVSECEVYHFPVFNDEFEIRLVHDLRLFLVNLRESVAHYCNQHVQEVDLQDEGGDNEDSVEDQLLAAPTSVEEGGVSLTHTKLPGVDYCVLDVGVTYVFRVHAVELHLVARNDIEAHRESTDKGDVNDHEIEDLREYLLNDED
jgi:hypothetical protein